MANEFTPPYLTPADEVVEMHPWMHLDRGGSVPLISPVDGWVTGTDIALSRGVVVDLAALRDQCRLPASIPLALVVSWRSDASKIQRHLFTRRLDRSRNDIQVTLPGSEIGGTIQITTAITLHEDVEAPLAGAPHIRGAVLVRDRVSVTLEGEGSMFPMAVVDFRTRTYDDRSSWFVETSTDLGANFSAEFQVFINERDKALIKAIEADNPTREQQALIDELSSGVMQVVLELAYALKNNGELGPEEHGDGSVGQVLCGLIEQTGNLDLGDMYDPSQIGWRQSRFQAMARRIAAGRIF
ncbi:hypothetical protein [Mycolicibacter hiberniae]|uniref:hypothetical protein n=1 Tax=Mycolicibacter hiberniae TaxID=29314 RepID=UPI000A16AA4F|nr:hypothetical protein [Mycolicibacter hiberniae]MCV7086975.1 hypothetical protein [Mycolicibacter hiberniae]ORV67989.1 hypothetical protein AWC09_17870 [Mycolicibacter hiberniae]